MTTKQNCVHCFPTGFESFCTFGSGEFPNDKPARLIDDVYNCDGCKDFEEDKR